MSTNLKLLESTSRTLGIGLNPPTTLPTAASSSTNTVSYESVGGSFTSSTWIVTHASSYSSPLSVTRILIEYDERYSRSSGLFVVMLPESSSISKILPSLRTIVHVQRSFMSGSSYGTTVPAKLTPRHVRFTPFSWTSSSGASSVNSGTWSVSFTCTSTWPRRLRLVGTPPSSPSMVRLYSGRALKLRSAFATSSWPEHAPIEKTSPTLPPTIENVTSWPASSSKYVTGEPRYVFTSAFSQTERYTSRSPSVGRSLPSRTRTSSEQLMVSPFACASAATRYSAVASKSSATPLTTESAPLAASTSKSPALAPPRRAST